LSKQNKSKISKINKSKICYYSTFLLVELFSEISVSDTKEIFVHLNLYTTTKLGAP